MKFFILTCCTLTLLLSSCGGGEQKQETPATDTSAKDSVAVDFPAEVDSLLSKFPRKDTWPLVLDSITVSKTTEGDSLPSKDFKYLNKNAPKKIGSLDYPQSDWVINSYLMIDSIKQAGGYTSYLETLDLGMIKDSKAYALFHMQANDSTLLFFYGIDYMSYEACPWSRGTYVFMTVVYGNKLGESILVAMEEAGGDPPAYGCSSISLELQENLNYHVRLFSLSDEDMDSPEIDTQTVFRHFMIKQSEILKDGTKEKGYTIY
jgi:hypothetical protein